MRSRGLINGIEHPIAYYMVISMLQHISTDAVIDCIHENPHLKKSTSKSKKNKKTLGELVQQKN